MLDMSGLTVAVLWAWVIINLNESQFHSLNQVSAIFDGPHTLGFDPVASPSKRRECVATVPSLSREDMLSVLRAMLKQFPFGRRVSNSTSPWRPLQ